MEQTKSAPKIFKKLFTDKYFMTKILITDYKKQFVYYYVYTIVRNTRNLLILLTFSNAERGT